MNSWNFIILSLAVGTVCFLLSNRRIVGAEASGVQFPSRPIYYNWYCALWCIVPALIVLAIWHWAETYILDYFISLELTEVKNLSKRSMLLGQIPQMADGTIKPNPKATAAIAAYQNLRHTSNAALTVVFLIILAIGAGWGLSRVRQSSINAQIKIEKFLKLILLTCSVVAVFTTIGIVLSVLFESLRFFQLVSPFEFFFSTTWSPQTAIRPDQVGSSGSFGAVPLFTGTLLITGIVMLVSVPIGLMTALYLSELAHPRTRAIVKPLLEILAGIPTVVYGFFAVLAVAPLIRDLGNSLGLQTSSESALAAGLVMGIMIIPFISSLSDDVINAVPQSLRDGSYALGATHAETILKVIFLAALPGIVGSILLAISRAIGETMIVVMAAGLAANLTANPLESVTTVTVQIVTLLKGDQEFDSPKTLAAFALGLTLFFITLVLNVIALKVVRKYREKYE